MYVDKASGKYRDITLMPDQDYHWLMSALRHGGEPLTMRIRKKVSPQGAYEDLVLMVHSVQRTTPPPGSSNADQECYLVKGCAEDTVMETLIDIGPDKNGRTPSA